MNIKLLKGIVLAMVMFFLPETPASAQEMADVGRRGQIVDSICALCDDWETVGISGKLKMDGLPLSPGVKIHMQRDSSIVISLRAPFMGEVGRAEIMGDSLLVVNKMKKVYVKESLSDIMSSYPVTLSDVQNLLLGHPVIAGFGVLSPELADKVEIYPGLSGQFSLLPSESASVEKFNYGYLFDDAARILALMVVPEDKENTMIGVTYDYGRKGYDITVVYESPKRTQDGTLELDYPVEDSSPIDPVRLNGRYKRLDFSDFMKSF